MSDVFFTNYLAFLNYKIENDINLSRTFPYLIKSFSCAKRAHNNQLNRLKL